MTKYTVVPSVWPVAGRAFRRGDIVTDDVLGPSAESYRRLGLIVPVTGAGTKKELLERARLAGIDVPKSATKAQIAELIAKEHHGV